MSVVSVPVCEFMTCPLQVNPVAESTFFFFCLDFCCIRCTFFIVTVHDCRQFLWHSEFWGVGENHVLGSVYQTFFGGNLTVKIGTCITKMQMHTVKYRWVFPVTNTKYAIPNPVGLCLKESN